MTAPLVSVILPVYNGEAYLAQAVDSVLQQTLRPFELIAIDDGSNDGSPSILASYRDRITVVRQANGGVAAARNAGIARARGEFVAFLDQDDYWLPEKAARQAALFAANQRLGLVHTAVAYYDQVREEYVAPQDPTARPEQMTGDCYESLLLSNPLVNSSVMVRRSVLEQVGTCDLRIRGNTVQDYDLWLRIAKKYEFAYAPEPLTAFRLHGNQGHRDRRAMLAEELKVVLRQRPRSAWRETTRGRQRLANIYDSLATAHFEAGEPFQARRYFAHAATIEPSWRRLARLGVCCLPFPVVRPLRQAWHRRTLRQSSASSGALYGAMGPTSVEC